MKTDWSHVNSTHNKMLQIIKYKLHETNGFYYLGWATHIKPRVSEIIFIGALTFLRFSLSLSLSHTAQHSFLTKMEYVSPEGLRLDGRRPMEVLSCINSAIFIWLFDALSDLIHTLIIYILLFGFDFRWDSFEQKLVLFPEPMGRVFVFNSTAYSFTQE